MNNPLPTEKKLPVAQLRRRVKALEDHMERMLRCPGPISLRKLCESCREEAIKLLGDFHE